MYKDLSIVGENDILYKIDLPDYKEVDGCFLLDRKLWYKGDGAEYLIKIDKTSESGESYNELVACTVAKAFGLNCVEYKAEPILVNNRLTMASVCKSYLNKYEHNYSLYELTFDVDIDYSRITKETLGYICNLLSSRIKLDSSEIRKYFMELALFDYLVLNTDRHLNNISFVHDLGSWRVAPIYDNSYSFLSRPPEFYIKGSQNMEYAIKQKLQLNKSVFNDVGLFGKVAVRNLAEEWLERTDNLSSLQELIGSSLTDTHVKIIKHRFNELLGGSVV